MVILCLKLICSYEGLEETNAYKIEFWIKAVKRDTYIKQRAKPSPTTMINQDLKNRSDDEDIDKRCKKDNIWFLLMNT
jgi:hypothetical protein